MEILITGATGFLGTALSGHLEAQGHRVVRLGSKNCDLTRPDSLDRFDDRPYDHIYHLAAWTQAGDFCLHHQGEQWLLNQKINTHVLSWWQARQPQAKLIAMGTSCAYPCDRELVEENYLEGQPTESLFTYAMTKRMLLVGLRALSRQYGLRHLCLVPSTLYGPGYHTDSRQMHFIFDLIRKILRAGRGGPPPVLWGDGHQRRELVYIYDFVHAAARLAGSVDDALINIGAGEEFSIHDFARMICELTGYDPDEIQYDTTKYVGVKSKCLSNAALRRHMPDIAMTPLRVGLARTIEWFQDNLDLLLDLRTSDAA
jgi:GDP-L-fucose synthase